MVEIFVSLGTVILLLDNSLGKCLLKENFLLKNNANHWQVGFYEIIKCQSREGNKELSVETTYRMGLKQVLAIYLTEDWYPDHTKSSRI